MVVQLNQTQQERIYNSFQRTWHRIAQMDETTRRKQMSDSYDILQERVNEKDLQGLHLQEAIREYLLIREHEEALHLSQTAVPLILLPHFQYISNPGLQAAINRLAVFPTSAVLVDPPQPADEIAPATPFVVASPEVKNKALIDYYNAVRNGRVTHPETIRELARRFFEIENDPETSKNFPHNAGRAARNLLGQAKWYEDQASAGDIYDANAGADMPGRCRSNDNLMTRG